MEKRMERKDAEQKVSALFFLKCLLFSYILTTVLLLLLAFLLYKLRWKESVVSVAIILIYVVATFFAGFLAGKKMQSKKFIWGLVMGGIYFLVLAVLSLAINRNLGLQGNDFITTFFLCAGGGMLGGMLS